MIGKYFISHTMPEVMEKLQHVAIVEDEDDFLVITDEDLEASVQENRNSCYGKILVEKELNIQNIRRCLCHAWQGNDFRICEIGTGIYQFFFKKKNTVEFILTNGPLSVDNHLLLLTPWLENFQGDALSFHKMNF